MLQNPSSVFGATQAPGPRRAVVRLRHCGGAIVLLGAVACNAPKPVVEEFPLLRGPYLGQTPPGEIPQVFAPGIVSTGTYERDIAMTPDGAEIYYGLVVGRHAVIMQTRLVDDRWTEPQIAPFSRDPRHMTLEPHISPDGQRFFFLSTRPPGGGSVPDSQVGEWVNQDIWVMDRTDDGWSEPYNLGPPVNSDQPEFFPSVTLDGTLYFTREEPEPRASLIYRSRLVDGRYLEPERLPREVNSTDQQYNAFIAPDERYIVLGVFGREDAIGGTDYYVVFRNQDDTWSRPVNLGDRINRARGAEWSPYVSPDGKYFFFMSTRPRAGSTLPEALTADHLRRWHDEPGNGNPDIYWVDAGFIDALRPSTP